MAHLKQHAGLMRIRLAAALLLTLATLLPAQQNNTIYGTVGDYGLSPQSDVQVVASLLWPQVRTAGSALVRLDKVTAITDSQGNFHFNNLLWGKYSFTLTGATTTTFVGYVGTNVVGSWPLSSLITNAAALPPNNATNYYTQAQVDALIAALPGGSTNALTPQQAATLASAVTNKQPGPAFQPSTTTASAMIWPFANTPFNEGNYAAYPNAGFVWGVVQGTSEGDNYVQTYFSGVPNVYTNTATGAQATRFATYNYDPSGVLPSFLRISQDIHFWGNKFDLEGGLMTNGFYHGDASSLYNYSASNLIGTLSVSNLPAFVATNGQSTLEIKSNLLIGLNGTYPSVSHIKGIGAFVVGYGTNNGGLQAYVDGSMAQGYADDTGTIVALGRGSFAGGYALTSGDITVTGDGSIAYGNNKGTDFAVAGNGGFNFGFADYGNQQIVTKDYAGVIGGNNEIDAIRSYAIGVGNKLLNADSSNSVVIGYNNVMPAGSSNIIFVGTGNKGLTISKSGVLSGDGSGFTNLSVSGGGSTNGFATNYTGVVSLTNAANQIGGTFTGTVTATNLPSPTNYPAITGAITGGNIMLSSGTTNAFGSPTFTNAPAVLTPLTNTVAAWLPVTIGGTNYFIPLSK